MSGLSQYATQEPAALLFFERANYIAVNVGLIAYGMLVISVFTCAYYLIKQKNGLRTNWKWLLFIFVLFACGTGNISINMKFNEYAWIDFRQFPGGPLAFLLTEQADSINTAGNAISIVISFLADALLIYRVYVVFRKWYIIVIPILTWLATTILGALFVVQAALPGSSLWAHITLNFSLPYFSMGMGLNILLTGMLVTRLMYMRYKIMQALGPRHGDTYMDITSMLLESAAPYGIISLVFLVLYSIGNTAAILFIPLLVQVECISPILIIMRVAKGRAWSKETISEDNLSRMKFGQKPMRMNLNSSTVIKSNTNSDTADISLGTFKASSSEEIYSESKTMGAESV